MGGMEFTWKMASVLVWPLVVLVLGIIFRGAIGTAFGTLITGLRRVKAAGVELDFAMASAWNEVTEVLADVPDVPQAENEVPSNLVDLYPTTAKNPRRGVRMAFEQVRRALGDRFPDLAGVAQTDLPAAMRRLVEHGAMDPEVEQAVNQVSRVLALFAQADNTEGVERRSFEFIGLAEGAIHAVLRSESLTMNSPPTRTAHEPTTLQSIVGRWSGNYVSSKGVTAIILVVSDVDGDTFNGKMCYPEDPVAQTRVAGRVIPTFEDGFIRATSQLNGVNVEWRELGYIGTSQAHLEFSGTYRATVFEREMVGEWRKGDRLVGMVQMARGD